MEDLKQNEAVVVEDNGGPINHNREQLNREDLKRTTSMPLPPALQGMTAEELADLEVKVRRKIDFRLLPMIVLMYILNYLDRNNISSAKLAGLSKDLHLTGDKFQV